MINQSSFNKLIENFLENNQINANKFAIALSGGIDSMALAFLLNNWAKNKSLELTAIIVNHNLRQSSTIEAENTKKIAESFGLKASIVSWIRENNQEIKSNIEAKAREKRYELINDFCIKNSIKFVFLAHHLDDQIETFLLRLERGSGIDGLSAMSEISSYKNITLLRPLLDIKKADLKQILIDNNIKWIDDPSNDDKAIKRNNLRQILTELFSGQNNEDKDLLNQRIAVAISNITRAKNYINSMADKHYADMVKFSPFGFIYIQYDDFVKLDEEIALRLLIKSLQRMVGDFYKPRQNNLITLYQELLKGKLNKKPKTFYDCTIQTYDNHILIIREASKISQEKLYVKDFGHDEILWDNRFNINIRNANSLLDKGDKILYIDSMKPGYLSKIKEKYYPQSKKQIGINKIEFISDYSIIKQIILTSYVMICESGNLISPFN